MGAPISADQFRTNFAELECVFDDPELVSPDVVPELRSRMFIALLVLNAALWSIAVIALLR